MKISKQFKHREVFSDGLRMYLRKNVKSNKKTEVVICNCKMQTCHGRFIKKFEWQKYCMWEMLRRGLIKDPKELVEGKKYEN